MDDSKGFSSFDGKLVVDEEAKKRIEAQHAALKAAGVKVDETEQLYATGTRMAEVGYATQQGRKRDHDAMDTRFADAAAELCKAIEAEKREDVTLTASEFAKGLKVNGKVTVDGFALTEQAIRGLMARLESPALGYVLGLRDRCAAELRKPEDKRNTDAARGDRAKVAEVIFHECMRSPDVKLKLRRRNGVGDIFATVSPSYTPADAPEVVAKILFDMPWAASVKGSWAYDAASTSWELRGSVWTPTPVEEQAVGEAFRGFVSFQSRDDGTKKFCGGGGVELLRCLNASTYIAEDALVARMHRGKVLVDIARMLSTSVNAIRVLCKAWGVARETVINTPMIDGRPVPDALAIPGLWWSELTDRKSELVAALPGRTASHVESLTSAYFAERRDGSRITRADFAQGWTRYIQDQPTSVRREAEAAIGAWIVNPRPMRFDAERVQTIIEVWQRDGSVKHMEASEAIAEGIDPQFVGRKVLGEMIGEA